MNKIEEIKKEKDGLEMEEALFRYAELGWRAITDDDKERLKWWGIFFRKPTPGFFMMRVRIPNGITNARQFRTIAKIASEFGISEKGFADITTRQQIQLRNMTIEQVPEILERLKAVGLTTLQTGMDNIRNVVGCPVAGLHPGEIFDASYVVQEFTKIFVGNKEFTNLPRKFNPTITGCPDNCTHAETQDLSLTPAEKEVDGKKILGFHVSVGGKMGSGGLKMATSLDLFVSQEEAPQVASEIVKIFRDYGSREARNKSRIAFLVEEWGPQKFLSILQERLKFSLKMAGTDLKKAAHSDHIGIFRQKQEGLNYIGIKIPTGRVLSEQFLEFADLAEKYGSGDIRLTIDQNIILPNIPDERIGALAQESLISRVFSYSPSEIMRGLVACTGREFCGLALIETKQIALEVARKLEEKIPKMEPLTIHWSGCPAGCGNHLAADIGLQGAKTKVAGKVVDAAHLFLKGEKILEAVPLEQLPGLLEIMAPRLVREGKALREAPREIVDPQAPPAVMGGKKIEVKGQSIAVFEVGQELYATDAVCPHEGGPLEQGVVEKGCVTCPWHNYRFNLKTGVCVNEPSLKVATYKVEKKGEEFVVVDE